MPPASAQFLVVLQADLGEGRHTSRLTKAARLFSFRKLLSTITPGDLRAALAASTVGTAAAKTVSPRESRMIADPMDEASFAAMPERLDHDRECWRRLATARVIKMIAGEWRTPVGKDADKLALRDIRLRMPFR
jgi:hypothetical protein